MWCEDEVCGPSSCGVFMGVLFLDTGVIDVQGSCTMVEGVIGDGSCGGFTCEVDDDHGGSPVVFDEDGFVFFGGSVSS